MPILKWSSCDFDQELADQRIGNKTGIWTLLSYEDVYTIRRKNNGLRRWRFALFDLMQEVVVKSQAMQGFNRLNPSVALTCCLCLAFIVDSQLNHAVPPLGTIS